LHRGKESQVFPVEVKHTYNDLDDLTVVIIRSFPFRRYNFE
jgi:hypothetical protein